MRPHNFDAPDALRPLADEPPVAEPPADEDTIDPGELTDAPDVPPDSISRLTAQLGAEVVEERPRERGTR